MKYAPHTPPSVGRLGTEWLSEAPPKFFPVRATSPSLQVVGVADGVSSVEAEGYDPSRLPVELLTECSVASRERQQNPTVYDAESESLWSTWDVPDFDIREFPRHILARASASCRTWGATTCVLCMLDKNHLWTVNVGDSQALHLRRTNTPPSHGPINRSIDHSACFSVRSRIADLSACGGYQIVQRVAPQQHFFNCPFQLTRMPDSDCSFGELLRRTSVSADVARHEVQAGDIVIVGSDGLFDNLFDEDILQVVNELCWHRSRPGQAPATEPFQVAERLLEVSTVSLVASLLIKDFSMPDLPPVTLLYVSAPTTTSSSPGKTGSRG